MARKRLSDSSAYAAAALLTEATGGEYRRKKSFPSTIYEEIREWFRAKRKPPFSLRVWWANIDQESRDALEGQ